MIPVFHGMLRLLAPEFTLTAEDLVQQGRSEVLRVRANLAAPIDYAGHRLYPFGWNGVPRGGFQVTLTLSGILQYSAWMLILVLAWPLRSPTELAVRLALWIPLAMLLIAIDTPLTLIAELWNTLRDRFDPNGFCGWMVWARFLQGGGGLLLGGLLAVLCIAAADCLRNGVPRPKRPREAGYARLVVPRKSAPSERD
jgi:hypothetical protein